MFAAIIFVFLSLLVSVSVNDKVVSDVNYQIDKHVQGIISNRSVDTNYWFLTQMANSSEWIDQLIVNRINQLNENDINRSASCLFSAFNDPRRTDVLTTLQSRLFEGAKCISDSDLFVAFIYEIDEKQRRNYLTSWTGIENYDEVLQAYINRSVGKPFSNEKLFQYRSIRLVDHYLFVDHDRSDSQLHQTLIQQWFDELIESSSLIDPLDFIKLQTVVTSHHTLDQKFNENYSLLPLIHRNRNYPTTVSKHILFKRIAFTATAFGYYQNALNFYREDLLPLSESIMGKRDFIIVQQDYATLLFQIGNINGALTNYIQIYESDDIPDDVRFKSSLLNNLAVSYLNAGYFDQYIQLQLEAYELAKESNSIGYQLQILNNLYIFYKNNNDWNRAKLYLDEAERIAINENLSQELANIKLSMATYHRDHLQDSKMAIQLINNLIDELNPTDYYAELKSAIGELAITYEQLNDYNGIVQSRNKLFELATLKDDRISIIESRVGLAIQQFKFNLIEDAFTTSKIIDEINPNNFDFRLKVQIVYTQALRSYHSGNLNSAIQTLDEIMPELISSLKQSGDLQTGSIYIDPSFRRTFSLLVDLYLETGQNAEALAILDEFKNLNKASYLNSPLLKSSILTEDELLLDLQVNAGIEQLRGKLIGADQDERLALNNELIQLQNQQNILFNKILNNHETKPLDLRYIVSRLNNNESILSYTAIDSSIYVSTISLNVLDVKKLDISTHEKSDLNDVINGIESGRPDVLSMFDIAQKYVLPFVDNNTERLIVIPDAFLYRIPIEIFPVSKPLNPTSYGNTTYLVEKLSVTYNNSISDFLMDFEQNVDHTYELEFLGFGVSNFNGVRNENGRTLSPLPFARTELIRAQNYYSKSNQSKIFIDRDATKTELFRLAPNSKIVHLASHSSVHQADPLFSQIYLSNSGEGNTTILMYAYELFDLSLKTELMVLSSCESGGGTYAQGSGIIGLGRALKFAGAKSLILNSWSIRDQTAADMMGFFYKYLTNGISKDESLRSAKIEYLNKVNSNPAVWGSLILYGNNTEIDNSPNYLNLLIAFLSLVTLSFVARKAYLRYFM